jgi:hypothetical protein
MMTAVCAVVILVMMMAQVSHWRVKQTITDAAFADKNVGELTKVQLEHLEGVAKMKEHFPNWTLGKEYFWCSVIRFTTIFVCFYYI